MNGLRRPAAERPLALVAVLLAAVVAIAAVLLLTRGHRSPANRPSVPTSIAAPAAPAAVIGTRAPSTITPAQLTAARRVARRFLASYLPVLYGRRSPSTIVDADLRVRAELRDAARTPRAARRRHPTLSSLTTRVQNATTVVTVAVIDDHVAHPYQVVVQLSRLNGGWQVTQLANY